MKHTEKQNLLYKEKSPYLLQHKDNPVHWQPWSEASLALAKAENKPIFLSIGYSTCYWCHAMEKDSFETEEIANLLNQDFISIKVDREERPDVDNLYMNAVVAMSGHGGWPMSVFLTPEGFPFFGATFFWKTQFAALLKRITELWQTDRAQIQDSAEKLAQHLQRLETPFAAQPITNQHLQQTVLDYQKVFDADWGGFGNAPKFPPHMSLRFLMRMYHDNENQIALKISERTLEMMARGGIYDHIGAGFSRYSTDEMWLVPHFEKMLYDNAQLIETYLEAYQITKRTSYLDVVTESLNYILREMTNPQGGFYSAQDAGPVGREGEFYLWKKTELEPILTSDELNRFCEVFGVTEAGNFEHRNVLHLAAGVPWESREESIVLKARSKLFEHRGRRVAPLLDDKILTDWNALMIVALAKSYRVTADKRYLLAAQDATNFSKNELYRNGILLHRYRDGEAKINGFLIDYAYLIHALLELYQADFNEEWLTWAKELQDKQDQLFWDQNQAGYFSAEENQELFSRSKEFNDSVTPSGNSVSYLNLLRLAALDPLANYKTQAEKLLDRISGVLVEHPSAFPFMLSAIHYQQGNMQTLVVAAGKDDETELNKDLHMLNKVFNPQLFLAKSNQASAFPLLRDKVVKNSRLTYYLCSELGCSEPIHEINNLQNKKLNIRAVP